MTYEIDLLHPSAIPGAAAQTESLGPCQIITRNVFITVTEHNGNAHLILLDELTEVDRVQPRLQTVTGRTLYPRRVDLPAKIFVETSSGHARAVGGDQIARLIATRRTAPKTGRLTW
jgi:hypothetical protein